MSDMVYKSEEYSWIRYIKNRIKQNKNMIMLLSGPTGSGKSWSGLSMGELLDSDFNINRVIFRGRELMSLINGNHLKSGSVILWDEAGVDLSNRNWQSITNKMLNYLMQTFRHKNFILIMTTPYADFVDKATRKLFHAEIRTELINYAERKVRTRPQLIQYNSRQGKFYFKYLRLKVEGGIIPVKTWNIPAPSQVLVEAYEAKKTAFTDQLNKEIGEALEGLDESKHKPLTPIQEEVVEALIAGKLLPDIAKERNINLSVVYDCVNAIRKKGIKIKPLKQKGGVLIGYEVSGYV